MGRMGAEGRLSSSAAYLEHGDIRRSLRRNAAPCTATGCKWPKHSNGYVYVPISISSQYSRWPRPAEPAEPAEPNWAQTPCVHLPPTLE